jgi:hypothetical protein
MFHLRLEHGRSGAEHALGISRHVVVVLAIIGYQFVVKGDAVSS